MCLWGLSKLTGLNWWKNNRDTKQWTENRKKEDTVNYNLSKLKSLWHTKCEFKYERRFYNGRPSNTYIYEARACNSHASLIIKMWKLSIWSFVPYPIWCIALLKYTWRHPRSLSRHTAFVSSHDDIYVVSQISRNLWNDPK